jgi:hypothetical protein
MTPNQRPRDREISQTTPPWKHTRLTSIRLQAQSGRACTSCRTWSICLSSTRSRAA